MPTPRTTVRRLPKRGHYDRETIAAILDEGLIGHVGFVVDGQPFVIPTICARHGDRLYLHGSAVSRMLKTLAGGVPVCVTVTLLDGLVLARSVFNHSMNYRSVVVVGTATPVEGDEKKAALQAIAEHVASGRWKEAREPSETELKATLVLSLPLDEASAKVRTGPPVDEDEDYSLPYWAGVLPLAVSAGSPIPDPRLSPAISLPPSVLGWRRPRRG
jgi:nitroimidazol reductase NimA-like FMN-containing flavoprotein (pyridoxamine 5'-phosphate oxidase superfamily)